MTIFTRFINTMYFKWRFIRPTQLADMLSNVFLSRINCKSDHHSVYNLSWNETSSIAEIQNSDVSTL